MNWVVEVTRAGLSLDKQKAMWGSIRRYTYDIDNIPKDNDIDDKGNEILEKCLILHDPCALANKY